MDSQEPEQESEDDGALSQFRRVSRSIIEEDRDILDRLD